MKHLQAFFLFLSFIEFGIRFHVQHRKHIGLSDFSSPRRASKNQIHRHQWSSSEQMLSRGPTPSLPRFTSLAHSMWEPLFAFLYLLRHWLFLSIYSRKQSPSFYLKVKTCETRRFRVCCSSDKDQKVCFLIPGFHVKKENCYFKNLSVVICNMVHRTTCY